MYLTSGVDHSKVDHPWVGCFTCIAKPMELSRNGVTVLHEVALQYQSLCQHGKLSCWSSYRSTIKDGAGWWCSVTSVTISLKLFVLDRSGASKSLIYVDAPYTLRSMALCFSAASTPMAIKYSSSLSVYVSFSELNSPMDPWVATTTVQVLSLSSSPICYNSL